MSEKSETNIGHSKTANVKSIKNEEINNFLKRINIDYSLESNKKVISLGLFEENSNEIIAISQFSFPDDSLMKEKYTTEIFNVFFENDLNNSENFLKIVNHYIKTYNPFDLFFNKRSIHGKLDYKKVTDVFTEENGVFEWIKPNCSFYTYKITSPNSEKYYYGVRSLKIKDASIEDCQKDGYFGSGGTSKSNKFKIWKKENEKTLEKEILEIFSRKSEAYMAENRLIGDKWKTDPNCLNSIHGGVTTKKDNFQYFTINIKTCSIHGDVMHNGDVCITCQNENNISLKICEIHGESKHIGNKCYHCISENSSSMKNCEIHGETLHRGDTCIKCINENFLKERNCETHGSSSHIGDVCLKCSFKKIVSNKNCEIHGETLHRGSACLKCVSEKTFTMKECEVHGEVKHIGVICVTCLNSKKVNIKTCSIHGEAKHNGSTCYSCSIEKNVSEKNCKVHGKTKHIGDKCYKCGENSSSFKVCEIHGETLHSGNSCMKCNTKKRVLKNKVCTFCGEEYTPTSTKQKICKKDHFIDCEYCGEKTKYVRGKRFCSFSCGSLKQAELRRVSQ